MTLRDTDAAPVPEENDPVALAFRHYLLALRAHRKKKRLQWMPPAILETEVVSHMLTGDQLAAEQVDDGVKREEHATLK
jgi:hypothetical protein